MKEWYKEDLAFIHDVGFGDFAVKAAHGILETLAQSGIRDGLIVDLGCGSGLSALEFTRAGYKVLGIDISDAMIEIARRRAPAAEFRVGSLFKTEIPKCRVVTSISECINYLFDERNNSRTPVKFFSRVYKALEPGGAFIFDIAEIGQLPQGAAVKGFTEGKDWLVLLEKQEDAARKTLTRRIITFRKVGKDYRRSDEVHRQRLYKSTEIAQELRRAGFRVRIICSYGSFKLPKAHAAFIARKPSDF